MRLQSGGRAWAWGLLDLGTTDLYVLFCFVPSTFPTRDWRPPAMRRVTLAHLMPASSAPRESRDCSLGPANSAFFLFPLPIVSLSPFNILVMFWFFQGVWINPRDNLISWLLAFPLTQSLRTSSWISLSLGLAELWSVSHFINHFFHIRNVVLSICDVLDIDSGYTKPAMLVSYKEKVLKEHGVTQKIFPLNLSFK